MFVKKREIITDFDFDSYTRGFEIEFIEFDPTKILKGILKII